VEDGGQYWGLASTDYSARDTESLVSDFVPLHAPLTAGWTAWEPPFFRGCGSDWPWSPSLWDGPPLLRAPDLRHRRGKGGELKKLTDERCCIFLDVNHKPDVYRMVCAARLSEQEYLEYLPELDSWRVVMTFRLFRTSSVLRRYLMLPRQFGILFW